MGTVYTEITIKNNTDFTLLKNGYKKEVDARSITTTALVDTGAKTLVINEDVCNQLGLKIEESTTATFANSTTAECQLTEPVRINWNNRVTVCRALVVPGAVETLIGVIPLEDMDLIVDPLNHKLVGAHGDNVVHLVLSMYGGCDGRF